MNFDRIRELVWEQTFQSSKLSSVLVMLEEVGKFISGRTPKSDELASIGDIPYFKVGDMNTEGNEKVLRITSLFLKEALQKLPLPSRMEQKCSVRLFLTTPECAVFFANTIVKY